MYENITFPETITRTELNVKHQQTLSLVIVVKLMSRIKMLPLNHQKDFGRKKMTNGDIKKNL